MAGLASFDVSTGADLQEVDNAVNQATKEVAQRYDFKGSKASIAFDRAKATLTLVADDDFKMKALFDVLQSKLIKRGVPVKNLELGPVAPGAGDTVHREIKLTQGFPQERWEEHTSELQSLAYLVCRLLLEKKKKPNTRATTP